MDKKQFMNQKAEEMSVAELAEAIKIKERPDEPTLETEPKYEMLLSNGEWKSNDGYLREVESNGTFKKVWIQLIDNKILFIGRDRLGDLILFRRVD